MAHRKRAQGNGIISPAEMGARLKARRVAQGKTQTVLADEAGVTFQQIQKYERGANGLRSDMLQIIARALDVSPMYFLADGDEVSPQLEMFKTPTAQRWLTAFYKIQSERVRLLLLEMAEECGNT